MLACMLYSSVRRRHSDPGDGLLMANQSNTKERRVRERLAAMVKMTKRSSEDLFKRRLIAAGLDFSTLGIQLPAL